MSKAKMLAARELIKEKNYEEARALLKTVNSATSRRWLERLDQIDPGITRPVRTISVSPPPPPPSPQIYTPPPQSYPPAQPPPQPYTYEPPPHFYTYERPLDDRDRGMNEEEYFYYAENRKRRRRALGKGIEMIMGGVGLVVIGLFLASLPRYTTPGGPPPDYTLSYILLGGGALFLFGGIYVMRRGND